MPAKRSSSRAEGRGAAPLAAALWLGLATAGGFASLVVRGRLDWPPTELMARLATLAGCIALVGPVLLHGKARDEVGLGALIWLAAGLLIWVFDLAALARGEARSVSWATPLDVQPMGLSVLAVTLAGWRSGLARPTWAWTDVTGCLLGAFWIALAVSSLGPVRGLTTGLRW